MTELAPLAPSELSRLTELEQHVERGMKSFIEVGQALAAIRDEGLYRASHATFEAYLEERWDLSRRRGYQLIEAVEAVKSFHTPPTAESHARALASVPEEHREAAYHALEKLGRVTTETVRALANAPEESVAALAAIANTEPEFISLVADLVRETSGGKPTPSTVRSLAAIAHGIHVTGALDTQDGQQKPWLDMQPDERRAYLMANLDHETYERQQQHKANTRRTETAQLADGELDRVTLSKAKYTALRTLAAKAPEADVRAFNKIWRDDL